VLGRPLIEQPAMGAVLADHALESEAATAVALRLSRTIDEGARGDEAAVLLRRILAPALKFWVCKRAPSHAAETVECLGGFGYMEESRLARMYREAPLMSIWEGSGNVQALDIVRAIRTAPASVGVLMSELREASGADPHYDACLRRMRAEIDRAVSANATVEAGARQLAALIALCAQASVLLRHAPPAIADAFCATRLSARPASGPAAFGLLPSSVDVEQIVQRCDGSADE
jgi:putative acyl-CoA dehydrogenase